MFFILNSVCPQAQALANDKEQVMYVHADSADINQQTHIGTYSGDVQLDQGTTHIRAAMAMTTSNAHNQLVKAVLKGDLTAQAHYWVIPEKTKPEFHAYANTIYYLPKNHLIVLSGRALIQQGANSFSAPYLRYDTQAQHIISKFIGSQGTVIIYHPEHNDRSHDVIKMHHNPQQKTNLKKKSP